MIGRHAMGGPTSVGLLAVTSAAAATAAASTRRAMMTESLNGPGPFKTKEQETAAWISFDEWVRTEIIPKMYALFETYLGEEEIDEYTLYRKTVDVVSEVASRTERFSEYYSLVVDPIYCSPEYYGMVYEIQRERVMDPKFHHAVVTFCILGCISPDDEFQNNPVEGDKTKKQVGVGRALQWLGVGSGIRKPKGVNHVLQTLGEAFSGYPSYFKAVNMNIFVRIHSTGPVNAFMQYFYGSFAKRIDKEDFPSISRLYLVGLKSRLDGPYTLFLRNLVFDVSWAVGDSYTVEYAYMTLRWLKNIPFGDKPNCTMADVSFVIKGRAVNFAEQLICTTSPADNWREEGFNKELRVLCPSWKVLTWFFRVYRGHTWRWNDGPDNEKMYRTVYFCVAIMFLACEYENASEAMDEEVLTRMHLVSDLIFSAVRLLRIIAARAHEFRLTLWNMLEAEKCLHVTRRCRAFLGTDHLLLFSLLGVETKR